LRRFAVAVLVAAGLLGLTGCQVVLIGNPLDAPGATVVDTPTSTSVALAAPLQFRQVITQAPCRTTQGDIWLPDPQHGNCYLVSGPFLTVNRLDDIQPLPVEGTLYWYVDLKLTPTDSVAMTNWSEPNVGQEMALVTGGLVVSAAGVPVPITTDDLLLSGPLHQADANALKQRIITGR
jgi:preprotein translocase subunit SecD